MRDDNAMKAGWRLPHPLAAGVSERMRWYVNRLRCMTSAEMGHRALRGLALQAERWGLVGSAVVPPPELTLDVRPWIHCPAHVDAARYVAAADRMAAGEVDVFALGRVKLGALPRWNRDPRTGVEAPLTFGKLLDYRDPRTVGDIRYLWEFNRHQHFVTLAQAYALGGDARYFEVLRRHLESWLDACPYLKGPNWTSALEAAVRLINWSVAWQLLGGTSSPLFRDASGAGFRRRWLVSVYQHARFIRGYFSLHSSANNHLIGEAAGLFVAAVTWPYWPHVRAWREEAKAILEREILLQNAADGVNLEQAVSYQQFELDLLLVALLAGRANDLPFSAVLESRIEVMLEFLASIMDAGGNVPMFGDSDDGYVVRLAQEKEFCRYRSLLATGAILFRRGDFKARAGRLDDKTHWLLGAEGGRVFHALRALPMQFPARRAFPEGGYYVLGCDFETENEIRLIVDAGPLGYQTIAAHGHADALAFTLSVGGKEFFVDPGTYTYYTQSAWRRYFRGTAAHNTVRVDGEDQSQSGGNFMWLKKARAVCTVWRPGEDADVFVGWHDGYARLRDPVMLRRCITLDKRGRRIAIEDTLLMGGEHEVELFFHCSEQCRVESVDGGYALSQAGRTLFLGLPQVEGSSARVYHGSAAPVAGWISRRFDHKQPAPTIAWRARLSGHRVLRTKIDCGEPAGRRAAEAGSSGTALSGDLD